MPLSRRATRIFLLIFIASIILFAVLLTTLVLQGEQIMNRDGDGQEEIDIQESDR